jgi:predicted nucleotidyltransferase
LIEDRLVARIKTSPIDSGKNLDADIIHAFKSVNPQKIILFGSFAREEADRFSDIDIIIVYRTPKRFLDRLEELYRHWNIDRAVDILAYTPEEYEALLQESDFVREAVEKGRVVYENV